MQNNFKNGASQQTLGPSYFDRALEGYFFTFYFIGRGMQGMQNQVEEMVLVKTNGLRTNAQN